MFRFYCKSVPLSTNIRNIWNSRFNLQYIHFCWFRPQSLFWSHELYCSNGLMKSKFISWIPSFAATWIPVFHHFCWLNPSFQKYPDLKFMVNSQFLVPTSIFFIWSQIFRRGTYGVRMMMLFAPQLPPSPGTSFNFIPVTEAISLWMLHGRTMAMAILLVKSRFPEGFVHYSKVCAKVLSRLWSCSGQVSVSRIPIKIRRTTKDDEEKKRAKGFQGFLYGTSRGRNSKGSSPGPPGRKNKHIF